MFHKEMREDIIIGIIRHLIFGQDDLTRKFYDEFPWSEVFDYDELIAESKSLLARIQVTPTKIDAQSHITPAKFNAQDRRKVITELEKNLGVTLSKIGSCQKYLKDENGHRYWLFGGVGSWHGIPKQMMDAKVQQADDATVFIAKNKNSKIDIYEGSSKPFVSDRHLLYSTKQGGYHFTFSEKWGLITINQFGTVSLDKCLSINLDTPGELF